MKKSIALVLVAILLFSGFAFAEGEDEHIFTVGTFTPLTGYFFTDMWGTSSSDIDIRNLLHGYSLVEFNAKTGSYEPNTTVVSGMVVEDNDFGDHTYVISLCEDLYYSDGTPITAWDYAFTILFMSDPAIAELGCDVEDMSFIKGAENYRAGKSDIIGGVHVWSDYQFSITFASKELTCFYELGYFDINPYPIKSIAPNNSVTDTGFGVCMEKPLVAYKLRRTLLNSQHGYLSHPDVVSGAYTLASFDGETAILEINPYFKGDSQGNKPSIERIKVVTVTSENAVEKLNSGEVDLVNRTVTDSVIGSIIMNVDNHCGMTAYLRSGLSFISFCCESKKVESDAVRKALAIVFNKESFTSAYTGISGVVTEGFYGLGQWMFQLVNGSVAAPVAAPRENASSQEIADYNNTLDNWQNLNLDEVTVWEGTFDDAAELLVNDGWTLNENGEEFNPEKDTVRAKADENGELTTLDLELYCPEGTGVAQQLDKYFVKTAAKIGVKITITELPWDKLLSNYYRTVKGSRSCDMIFMGTNFDADFEPSVTFNPSDDAQGYENRCGIKDEALYQSALAMRFTKPGDTYTYCKKWIAFEKEFARVMPLIPIYTNVYYDFFNTKLHNYEVSSYSGWSDAIIKAYFEE